MLLLKLKDTGPKSGPPMPKSSFPPWLLVGNLEDVGGPKLGPGPLGLWGVGGRGCGGFFVSEGKWIIEGSGTNGSGFRMLSGAGTSEEGDVDI